MYAVTMKNVHITIGFGVITVSQLVLGAWTISLAVRQGGETEPFYCETHSHSERLSSLLQLRLHSPTAPVDTSRRVSHVLICPA